MIFPGLIMLLVMVVLIGIGIGAGLFACAIAAGLTMLGVISSSVALGFLTKRPATAVRALLLQCGILAGIPAGAVTAWVGRAVLEKVDESWMIAVYGGIGGAFAGAVLALLLDFIFRRTHAWLEERVKQHKSLPS
ncbi:hypothetical protein [Prosthecobacter vanneervenii]|uniref:Uncharacterized protein n=1 Tax=Prosthecobacter vanneervenii TaxID=48466 RepID=A0A7W7YAN3_9BACT|nr:hypothetical protein [Prosthecobacter vanneervenii]MBB5032713.1 hypothetical protein [Prosthecobacter vanneervenii]